MLRTRGHSCAMPMSPPDALLLHRRVRLGSRRNRCVHRRGHAARRIARRRATARRRSPADAGFWRKHRSVLRLDASPRSLVVTRHEECCRGQHAECGDDSEVATQGHVPAGATGG
eukprot:356367-Chlamydomonas_euryale.AAC.6